METQSLATSDSTLTLVKRGSVYVVLLDGAVVNTSNSMVAGQLFARGVRREIQAKAAYQKSVAA